MMQPNHPDDERLSALSSRDDDATADATLVAHVDSCDRCTDLVAEFGALRATLAELPDLEPHRPLRLLPAAADAPTGGAGAWIRRLFAPAMTAGAALALVGLVGTAAPYLGGPAGAPFQDAGSEAADLDALSEEPAAEEPAAEPDAAASAERLSPADVPADGGGRARDERDEEAAEGEGTTSGIESYERDLPAERSPWPMVLFSGLALIVAAALLRWILVPRAG